jgi:hypothetical protein
MWKIWCIYNSIEQTWKTPPLPTHIRTYIRTYLPSLYTLPYGTIRWHGTRKKPNPGPQPRPARRLPSLPPPLPAKKSFQTAEASLSHSLAIDHASPCNADEEKKPKIGVRIFAQRSIAVASSGGCGCFSIAADGHSRR